MTTPLPVGSFRRDVVRAYRHPLVWRARDLSLNALTEQTGVLTRTTTKAVPDSFAVNRTVNHSQPAWAVVSSLVTLDLGASENLKWVQPFPVAAMSGLAEFLENGTLAINGAGVCGILNAAGANPRVAIAATGTQYQLIHHNGTSQVLALMGGTAPTSQQRVRLRWWLYADGKVQLWQSINGAAETTSGATAALTITPWSTPTAAWLNSQGDSAYGANRFLGCVVMMGNQTQAKLLEALA